MDRFSGLAKKEIDFKAVGNQEIINDMTVLIENRDFVPGKKDGRFKLCERAGFSANIRNGLLKKRSKKLDLTGLLLPFLRKSNPKQARKFPF